MGANPFETLEAKIDRLSTRVEKLLNKPEPESKPSERYLTIDETAELLSVTRVTLWSWNKKGILESVRIGNLRRYRLSDIEALAAHQLDKKQENE